MYINEDIKFVLEHLNSAKQSENIVELQIQAYRELQTKI